VAANRARQTTQTSRRHPEVSLGGCYSAVAGVLAVALWLYLDGKFDAIGGIKQTEPRHGFPEPSAPLFPDAILRTERLP
jgi:hypothetical protein